MPPDRANCPHGCAASSCAHDDERQMVYRVPEALRTPAHGSQKAAKATRREYGAPWYEGEACPLSSDSTHVRTFDHGWCRAGAVKKSPSSASGLYVQCDCSLGHKYPLRVRVSGDGNPNQN